MKFLYYFYPFYPFITNYQHFQYIVNTDGNFDNYGKTALEENLRK
jgi:hypothetical protein